MQNSLLNKWLMDFKESQIAEAAKKSEEENQKRAQMMQFVQYLEAEHARKEQLKQRALEFAENLKLKQQQMAEQKRYNNERLNISKQKLSGPSMEGGERFSREGISTIRDPNTGLFEKEAAKLEAQRTAKLLEDINQSNIPENLREINDVKQALKQVTTGGVSGSSKRFLAETFNSGGRDATAFGKIERFSAEQIRKAAQDLRGSLSEKELDFLKNSNFGIKMNNKNNQEILDTIERGYRNKARMQEFISDYEANNGTLSGWEKAWRRYINDSRNMPDYMEEKKKDEPIRETSASRNNNDYEKELLSSGKNTAGSIGQFLAGLGQGPLDIGYGIAGQEAPELVPADERNLAYTVGDIAGYLPILGGINKGLTKAGIKGLGKRSIIGASAVEGAKDTEDRIGGATRGAAIGTVGYGIGKGAEKALGSVINKGKEIINKNDKEKALDSLLNKEEKMAANIYDKVLGKYGTGENPSMNLVGNIQNKYDEALAASGKQYRDLFDQANKSGLTVPLQEVPEGVRETFKRYKSDNLKAEDIHEILSGLKEQQRANLRTLNSGDKVNVLDLKEEGKLLSKNIEDLQNFINAKVPGYQNVAAQYKENVVPYVSTKTGRNIVQEEQDIPNFAKKLNWGKEEGMRDLYNLLSPADRELAAAGEFLKGRNINQELQKNTSKISRLYQDLMSGGSEKARNVIEGKVGKEASQKFQALPKEIKDITEELQKISTKESKGLINKLTNLVSGGKLKEASEIITLLMKDPKNNKLYNRLKDLDNLLSIGDRGNVSTAILLSET